MGQIGCKIKFIAGDGNCLFRSLADQLEGRPEDHASIRENVRSCEPMESRGPPSVCCTAVVAKAVSDAKLSKVANEDTETREGEGRSNVVVIPPRHAPQSSRIRVAVPLFLGAM